MDQTFGDRLREARLARGWTQEQLAERAGLAGKAHVSMIERGDRPNPTIDTAVALARSLGVSLAELAGVDDGNGRKTREAAVERLRRELAAIVRLVDELEPR